MRASWQLIVLWGLCVGLGTGTMTGGLGAMVANRWFAQRRGLVMGLLTASNATGQLVFLPLLATLVVNVNWRAASLVVAGGAALVIPLVWLVMRASPRDIGERPYGAEPDSHLA